MQAHRPTPDSRSANRLHQIPAETQTRAHLSLSKFRVSANVRFTISVRWSSPRSFGSRISALSLVYEMSKQVQGAMENMLRMINEIGQNSTGIMEEIEKCKDSAIDRKKVLDEEKERFQEAAYAVLDILNNGDQAAGNM